MNNNDKKSPRYWSCRYWLKNNISDTLKEVIEPDSVDVSSLKINETLCPLIWENDKIKTDVKKMLLKNAYYFIKFSDIKNLKFKDIILTGSMANYNYNDNSDLDVHIILDFNQISENKDFVGDFLKLKKELWSDKINSKVKGHDVEMYFQDINDPHYSSGTYSLIRDKWIKKPTKKIININTGNVQLKSAYLMNSIDDLLMNKNKSNFLKKYELLKNKIKKYRQSGLETNGEYSTENLVFKILRNNGYLKKMIDMKNNYLNKELTLNEF